MNLEQRLALQRLIVAAIDADSWFHDVCKNHIYENHPEGNCVYDEVLLALRQAAEEARTQFFVEIL